jgi:hypothetical protein
MLSLMATQDSENCCVDDYPPDILAQKKRSSISAIVAQTGRSFRSLPEIRFPTLWLQRSLAARFSATHATSSLHVTTQCSVFYRHLQGIIVAIQPSILLACTRCRARGEVSLPRSPHTYVA